MTRAGGWSRDTGYSTASGYSGAIELAIVGLGQTVDRTLWAWNASFTVASTGVFPPAGGLVRVGLILLDSGMDPSAVPTPISDPGSPWMDIMSVPWRGNISTGSASQYYLGFDGFGGPDKEAKVRRTNSGPNIQSLYVSWDSIFPDDVGDAYAFYATAATDAWVLDAP